MLSLLGPQTDPNLDYLAHIEVNIGGLRAACFPSPPSAAAADALPSPHMLRLRPEVFPVGGSLGDVNGPNLL